MQGLDLGGLSFLHQYDWRADGNWSLLEPTMTAPMVVAYWINLQCYGSTVINAVFGSGNKVLRNVIGRTLGVLQSNGGGLLVGMPLRSVHDGKRLVPEPMRLNVFIVAPQDAIKGAIARHQSDSCSTTAGYTCSASPTASLAPWKAAMRGRGMIQRDDADAPKRSREIVFRPGVKGFAGAYDLFLVDQWGVLHDGQAPYPGALDCLRRLAALGKRVAILSNSGKRAADNAEKLSEIGFESDCYTALVSSGEVARERLVTRSDPFPPALGRRCLVLSSDGETTLTDGLGVEPVRSIDVADFILLTGVNDALPTGYYHRTLDRGAARNLPLVCVNPDLARITPGGLMPGAGALARDYEALGGTVCYIGKPHPEIYAHCRRLFADVAPHRIVAVGDSFYHDVVGGARAGLATALVTGGIHDEDFAGQRDRARRTRLAALIRKHGATPDWVIPQFRW